MPCDQDGKNNDSYLGLDIRLIAFGAYLGLFVGQCGWLEYPRRLWENPARRSLVMPAAERSGKDENA